MIIISFLFSLPSEIEAVKSQILSSSEISSLQDVSKKGLHIESCHFVQVNSNALVSHGNKTRRSSSHDRGIDNHNQETGRIL